MKEVLQLEKKHLGKQHKRKQNLKIKYVFVRRGLKSLNLVECDNVTTLDVLVVRLRGEKVFNEVVRGHKVINNGEHNREFLDPVTNWYKFCCKKLPGEKKSFN